MRAARDIATCMYHTGIDPFTGQEVIVSKGLRDRKTQRALMRFLEPENYVAEREALRPATRRAERRSHYQGTTEAYFPAFGAYPFHTHSIACGRNCACALPTLWPALRQKRYW